MPIDQEALREGWITDDLPKPKPPETHGPAPAVPNDLLAHPVRSCGVEVFAEIQPGRYKIMMRQSTVKAYNFDVRGAPLNGWLLYADILTATGCFQVLDEIGHHISRNTIGSRVRATFERKQNTAPSDGS